MKYQTRKSFILLTCVLFLTLLSPVRVHANAPAPASYIGVTVRNLPPGARVDLLLPREEMEEGVVYAPMNTDVLAQAGLTDSCELAQYEEDGYVSYLAHYAGVDKIPHQGVDNDQTIIRFETGFTVIRRMSLIRIAVYDGSGNILSVTEAFSIQNNRKYNFLGDIRYDAATGAVEPVFWENYWLISLLFLGPLTCLAAMLVTVICEVLVALPFGMKPLKPVVLTTALSNLVMNVCLLLFHTVLELNWFAVVIVLELAVLWAEFYIYKKKYAQHTERHVLIYTLVANAVSFAVGELIVSLLWKMT